MSDEPLVFTVPELAQVLKVSRRHAYEIVRLGLVPSVRFGKRIVVPVEGVKAFLRNHSSAPVANGSEDV